MLTYHASSEPEHECCNRVLIAGSLPTPESTIYILRGSAKLTSSGNKADKFSDNTASDGKDNRVAEGRIDEKIFNFGFDFSRVHRLSGSDCVGEKR